MKLKLAGYLLWSIGAISSTPMDAVGGKVDLERVYALAYTYYPTFRTAIEAFFKRHPYKIATLCLLSAIQILYTTRGYCSYLFFRSSKTKIKRPPSKRQECLKKLRECIKLYRIQYKAKPSSPYRLLWIGLKSMDFLWDACQQKTDLVQQKHAPVISVEIQKQIDRATEGKAFKLYTLMEDLSLYNYKYKLQLKQEDGAYCLMESKVFAYALAALNRIDGELQKHAGKETNQQTSTDTNKKQPFRSILDDDLDDEKEEKI